MTSMASIADRTRAALDGSAFVAWMLPPSSARPARAQGTMTITTETITRRRGVARLALAVGRNHSLVSRPRRIRHIGVAALARQLGLSVPHVSQVLSGGRTSRRVSEAARKAGVVSIEDRP